MPQEEAQEPEQWSPASELLESALGYEVREPDLVDIEYLEIVNRSWEKFVKSEAFNDLVRAVKSMEKTLTDEWRRGDRGAERNQRAVLVLSEIQKLPEFSAQRLENAKASKAKKNGWANRRGTQRSKVNG